MNKKLLLFSVLLLMGVASLGQPNLASSKGDVQMQAPVFEYEKAIGDVCGEYPNHYLMHKASGVAYYYVGNNPDATWYERVAQYNDCPQEMTIHGVGFSGFAQSVPSIDAIVQIFTVNADSTGSTLLASDTVAVSSGSYTSSGLVTQYYEADFDNPVTINQPYLVLIKNPTADTLSIYANNANNNDGQGEERALLYYNNTAFPSFIGWYHYNSSALGYDYDYVFSPIISFPNSIAPEFLTNDTLCEGEQFCLDYKQTGVFREHSYSMRAGNDSLDQIKMTWGDGLEINDLSIACHVYNDTGVMNISITDTLFMYGIPGNPQPFCEVTIDTAMYVLSEPIVGLSSDSDGSSLTINFSNESNYEDTYLWEFGDGNTSASENPSHTFASNGMYNVKLTVTNDCGTVSDSIQLDLSSVGFGELEARTFEVYPNPATNQVTIDSKNDNSYSIHVMNTLGQNVANFSKRGDSKTVLHVANWSKGMYFIQIKDHEGATLRTQKLVVR